MHAALQNLMRLQAQRATAQSIVARYGIVTNYDPARYAAKVTLQPEDFDTGYIPIAAMWAGPGWGMYAPPHIGQQVSVVFIEGNLQAGYVESYCFNSTDIPAEVPSGEFWLLHAKGGYFKLTNDGKVTFSDGAGATIQIDGSGHIVSSASQWTHTGNVQFEGNVAVSGTFESNGDGTIDGVDIKNHTHSGVQSGSNNSGPPT